MALSAEDRERIREEEWVRAQAREDFVRRGNLNHPDQNRFTGLAVMFAGILGVMAVFALFIRLFGSL